MELEKYIGCSEASRKLIPADLVLKNATYVNVFSGELDTCDIAVAEGLIAGTEQGGKVYLDPQGSATRGQVATILMRYIENVVK